MSTLYYGDNLDILRHHIPTASVDLVYLDPPFNSNRNYNVLFRNESGVESDAQIEAFEDTWHWHREAEATYRYLVTETSDNISKMIAAMRSFTGENQMMAYIVMMTVRLIELHRVLKPTGSLYLHCDPTASHYLKLILDTIFGGQNFRNEVIWKRSDAHNDATQGAKHFGRIHDTLLFYTKGNEYTFNTQRVPLSKETADKWYRHVDADGRRYNMDNLTAAKPGGDTSYEFQGIRPPEGRYWAYSKANMERMYQEGRIVFAKSGMPYLKRYLDESKGTAVQDLWLDIDMLRGFSASKERLGYPTQKPLALLERIINTSSNVGDVILDPFCGCGTAVAAAQKLGRQWIGIDITSLAIALMKYRLDAMYPGITYQVEGEPRDMDGAKDLAGRDRYQFQWWALSLIRAQPFGGDVGSRTGKKGSDQGVDGIKAFFDDNSNQPKRIIVQVKSGHVKASDVRDLAGTIEREKAAIGVFITLEEPSRDMRTEATTAGFYHSPGWNKDFPRLQILTIAELLKGPSRIDMPPEYLTWKQAQRVAGVPSHAQGALFGAGGAGDASDLDDDDGDLDDDAPPSWGVRS